MIVKNLMAVGIIASVATVAAAADEAKANWGIKGLVRMDAVQSTTETKVGDADKSTAKSSEVMLKHGDMTLTGDRGGDTMKIKFHAESGFALLDTATITHKFTDTVNVAFGKMSVLAQSWENDYDSSDQYIWSWAGQATPSNADGAQVNANFGDHNVSLQVVQGVKSITSSTTNATTGKVTKTAVTFNDGGSLTAALQYKGDINKMIKPILTYTSVKTSGTKGSDGANYGNGYQTQMGLGVQVLVADLTADLEYDTVKNHKVKDVTSAKDNDIASMILQAKYAIGMTTPFLKVVSETHKFGAEKNVGDLSGMQLALGAEHKLDENCRLHGLYMMSSKSEKIAGEKTTKTNMAGFNFGVTASM
ncbi:MAG: hypothetical protein NT027_17545 [Proteobacteria bacterium]|nr:hypothetical protein [Pseudomonadota bacterium]